MLHQQLLALELTIQGSWDSMQPLSNLLSASIAEPPYFGMLRTGVAIFNILNIE